MRKKEATCNTFLAPILCTMCPTVSNEISEPNAPVLISEPKPPLVRRSAALTSGNRGTQDIIPRPKVKKRSLK